MSIRNNARRGRLNPFLAMSAVALALTFVTASVPPDKPIGATHVAVDKVSGVSDSDEGTGFQDWNEVDSFWMGPWAGDDAHHRHGSFGTTAGEDWQLLRTVLGIGYRHFDLLPQWTMESGEHGTPETCADS